MISSRAGPSPKRSTAESHNGQSHSAGRIGVLTYWYDGAHAWEIVVPDAGG
jgi:hypothetical protein